MRKFILLCFGFFLFASGCYTVIRHPMVREADNSGYQREVYFTDNCMDCHRDDPGVAAPLHHPYLPRLNYIQENDRWSYFYKSPWWFRDIFYSSTPGEGNATRDSSGVLPTTSARSRFPGSGNRLNSNTATRISGGPSSGSKAAGSNSGTNPQRNIREKPGKSSARKAVRGSGNSKKKTGKPKNVERHKPK